MAERAEPSGPESVHTHTIRVKNMNVATPSRKYGEYLVPGIGACGPLSMERRPGPTHHPTSAIGQLGH